MALELGITERVKLALRKSGVDELDEDIRELIETAKQDLKMIGVEYDQKDPMIRQAVVLFCKMNYGSPEDYEYKRLKEAYDELKMRFTMTSNYTDWGGDNG